MAADSWKRIGHPARDPKTLSTKDLEEEKEWCLRIIKEYEEWKTNYQADLDTWTPTNTHGWETRGELKRYLQNCKSDIHLYQRHFTACQTREYKVIMEKKEEFSLSAKEECVPCSSLSGIMSGFTGVGKTHTLAMLTGEPPPSLRVSTPLNEVPTRTITHVQLGVEGDQLVKIGDEEFTEKLLVTAREGVSALAAGVAFKLKAGLSQLVSKPALPTDPVNRELLEKYSTVDESVTSLKGQVIVEISDCGGQPQFLEILPRYIEGIDFSILVTDLSQCFKMHPINYFFNEDGKSVGKGVLSPLNNEQVIRLHLQMVASFSHRDIKPKIVVVGTHKDLEGTYVVRGACKHKGECVLSREEKNQRLKEIVESFGLQDSIISKHHLEYIFAINAKTPEKVDHQTVAELKSRILQECPPRTTTIPISYHALELTLKRKAKETGHIAFNLSSLRKDVSHFHFTDKSFKSALQYLHKKRRLFYFEKEFPGRVIGEPQVVLNKQTELVVYSIQLSTNPEMLKELNEVQWRFVKYGFLTVSSLEKFPDHYVEGVFTPEDMLKLFVKLLMVSEVRDGEYLMPCVLPTDPLANCNPEPDTQSVPPMVLHFPGGPARYGVFCGTICHVMTKSKWELVKDPVTDEPFHITRNSVHFHLPGSRNKVTLNDPFDSFFVITVHIPADVPKYSETVSKLCIQVRDTLLDAISKVTAKLNYSAEPPKVSFLCTEHKDVHPATVSDEVDELLCCKVRNAKGGVLTTGHKVWLRDSLSEPYPEPFEELATSDKSKPLTIAPSPSTLNLLKWWDEQGQEQIFRLVSRVSSKWREFGLALDLTSNELDALDDQYRGVADRAWNRVMEHWRQGGSAGYPATWAGLYCLLGDMEYGEVASQLEAAVTRSVLTHN